MLARIARASYRHRRAVVGGWLVVLLATIALTGVVGGKTASSGRLPGTDSQQAQDLLRRQFPQRSGGPATIVFGNLPGHRPMVDRYLHAVAGVHGVTELDPLQVAPGGRIAIAPVTMANDHGLKPSVTATYLEHLARPLRQQGVNVQFSGNAFSSGGLPATEAIGLLAAVIILILGFGSVVAMGLPIVTAVVGLGLSAASIGLVARFFTTPSFASQVASIIAIGVGIDYALFIVTRYRAALLRLDDPEGAIVEAISTSGRAVVFAGSTVVVSLLAMFLMGLDYLHGLAVGTSLAVAIAVAAALTLLPALVGFIGFNIDRLHAGRRSRGRRVGLWERWAGFVQRHPRPLAASGLALLVVMAMPLLGIRLGFADAGNDPGASTTRQAFDLVARGFGPGANGPIVVVADTSAPGSAAALSRLVTELRQRPGVARVDDPITSPSGTAAVVTVTPTSGPQDAATMSLLHRIRDLVPRSSHVGGETASAIDFSDVMTRRLPVFFGSVLVVSFLILLVVFRSIVVPLKAVVMNLMSIGAAFGVLVVVFQRGHGGHVLGVSGAPIEAWAPMMLFAIVFGLSMDYEVFLLSTIREHYDATGDNAASVTAGLAGTARVITAAAAVMVVVFGSFLASDVRALKEIGLGLSLAIAVDATIVRVVLVPATMELLGRANWWLPSFLGRRLPRVTIEGEAIGAEESRQVVSLPGQPTAHAMSAKSSDPGGTTQNINPPGSRSTVQSLCRSTTVAPAPTSRSTSASGSSDSMSR
jgi:RND superfamily putative drug exporter